MFKKKQAIASEEEIVLTGGEKEISTEIAKCPSCGGNMVFYPENQSLRCEYCDTEKKLDANQGEEQSFENLLNQTNQWSNETHIYSCNNCGAKQIISKSEISTHCSFCGTSNIAEENEVSGLKPNAVVPFKLTKENALSKIVEWVKKKLFAPKKFKNEVGAEQISGVYNPAFTFDASTYSYYHGRLGRYIYETKVVNGKRVTERRVQYFSIRGSFGMMFDDVLIQASETVDQRSINKLQPFCTGESKAFSNEFLHGYSANQYTKDGRQCWNEAKKLIDKRIRRGILSKYSYDVVDSLYITTSYQNQTYKYMLLPLYVGCFNWKNKKYNFYVNGYNGKVTGKTPVSALKVLILLGIIAGTVITIFLLYKLLGG